MMIAVHHDPLLRVDVLLLLRVNNVLLLQALQSIRLALLLGDLQFFLKNSYFARNVKMAKMVKFRQI